MTRTSSLGALLISCLAVRCGAWAATPPEMPLAQIVPGAVGEPLPLRPLRLQDGALCYDGGGEVALWGVNYQPSLSWEYHATLKPGGVALERSALQRVIDADLAHLKLMHTGIIRVHLLPGDFTDAHGDLVETPFLDALDYLLERCRGEGIYVYLTLVNAMGKPFLAPSFMGGFERNEWMVNEACVAATRHYVTALLTRVNRYGKLAYARQPALAILEIINEPDYPGYKDIQGGGKFEAVKQRYLARVKADRGTDDQATFLRFRGKLVATYLADLVADIRAAGATQPIAWNLNWPGFASGHDDVCEAVSASAVDAISFCVYPGQGDLPQDYWNHPTDLSQKNYLPYLQKCYDKYWDLRSMLGVRFARKAKLVYEFETFYNQSSYLYPEMARLFRALGAQVATMWRYVPLAAISSLHPSSNTHLLNLVATPRKAVSAMIAADAFRALPRYAPYRHAESGDSVFGAFATFATSFSKDLSVESDGHRLLHTRTCAGDTPPFHPGVREIAGVGSSPAVTYGGTGCYLIRIDPKAITVQILPDVITGMPPYLGLTNGVLCRSDETTPHRMELHLPDWDGSSLVWKLTAQGRTPMPLVPGTLGWEATAGEYVIERKR